MGVGYFGNDSCWVSICMLLCFPAQAYLARHQPNILLLENVDALGDEPTDGADMGSAVFERC